MSILVLLALASLALICIEKNSLRFTIESLTIKNSITRFGAGLGFLN